MANLSSAWADQVENEEATNGALANNSDFPSLGEAAKQPAPSKKAAKSKGKKMSLTDFIAQPGAAAGFQDKSLQDKAILMSLPTAPRGLRDGEDPRAGPGMGGGFRDYGGRDGGFRGERGERGDRPPRAEMEPSRADAVDDWGTTRKFVPGGGDGGSRGFGGGFGDRDRAPREPREFKPSAADEVDDWGAQRKFEPSAGARGFGDDRRGGFGDRERRFDGPPPPSKADMEDSWGRGREFKPTADAPSRPSRGFSGDNASAADKEERWGRRAPEPSTSAAESSAPSERPRLKLAPRSVPADGAGAGSSDAAGAGSKSNPFGAARPREEVLKEKGVDPVKEALKLEHGEVIREETAAEKALKEEVATLTAQLEELKAVDPEGDVVKEAAEKLDAKERELLKLQAEEDDKVRFARGGTESRDGPGAKQQQGGSREPPARKERW